MLSQYILRESSSSLGSMFAPVANSPAVPVSVSRNAPLTMLCKD